MRGGEKRGREEGGAERGSLHHTGELCSSAPRNETQLDCLTERVRRRTSLDIQAKEEV